VGIATKSFVDLPSFDPLKGSTIREPLGSGKGYWVGAPSATYVEEDQRFYLAYRLRNPREKSPSRGFQCEIAESEDGINFQTLAKITSESLPSPSIEKSALVYTEDGMFRLYISYVDPITSRWRIDLLEASHPAEFDSAKRIPVLTAEMLNSLSVKDPCVFRLAGSYYMMASYIPNYERVDEAELLKSQDASAIGLAQVFTALLKSKDGVHFKYVRDLISPGSHWDKLSTVGTSLAYTPPWFTIFFDGRRDASESYEGRAGLAVTSDFERIWKVDEFAPRFLSPNASKSLRYIDVVQLPEKTIFYYEYARQDGSHELRVNVEEKK
jgi:hypothetical protein